MKRSKTVSLFAGLILLFVASNVAHAQPLRKDANEPGYLGLVTDDRQEAGTGVRVMEAVPGGPAAKAGLQAGDLVTAIDGKPVRGMDGFAVIMSSALAGTSLEFQVKRAGVEQKMIVTLVTRPKSEERMFPEFGRIPDKAEASSAESSGSATVPPATPPQPSSAPQPSAPQQPLTPPQYSSPSREPPRIATGRALLGVESVPVAEARLRNPTATAIPPVAAGAVIRALTPGAPAVRAGLKIGDIIVSVDGHSIRDPDDLAQRVRQSSVGKEVEVMYMEGNQMLSRRIVLADSAILNAPSRTGSMAGEELPSGAAPSPFLAPRAAAPMATAPSAAAPRVVPPAPPQPMLTEKPIPQPPGIVKRLLEEPGRVEALEKRVQELEQRIADLEARLKEGK